MDIMSMLLISVYAPLVGAIWARTICHVSNVWAKWGAMLLMTISLVFALALFRDLHAVKLPINLFHYSWIELPSYQFNFGFYIDGLSLLMLVIITGISWIVHVYSLGYMKEDQHIGRFFSYVSFFTFAMLILVMGDNLLQLFFGWEGVGVASYLLIGFWQTKPYPTQASLKAFIVNRIADMGLMVVFGLILIKVQDLSYAVILPQAMNLLNDSFLGYSEIDWICFGLFFCAMGKSAQLPLHVWLPDSMAGPTPISALIHAATMVTAGVYLVSRFAPWFEFSPAVQAIIVWIGILTMILMGLVALTEYDIKRIIAYSTLSQLGMMMAVSGISGYVFSIYHLATHACFKALLFLSAGGMIVVMDHEQDIRKLMNLKSIPSLYLSMLVGSLSMIAIPPLSGFFSKDAMLSFALASMHPNARVCYVALVLGALITTAYSTRLFIYCFKQTGECALKPMPKSMSISLYILTFLSIVSGYWLAPWVSSSAISTSVEMLGSAPTESVLSTLSYPYEFVIHALSSKLLSAIFLTVVLMFFLYFKRPHLIKSLKKNTGFVYRSIQHAYGFDQFYQSYVTPLYQTLSHMLSFQLDRTFIDKYLVHGLSRQVLNTSKPLTHLASGKVNHYVLIMLIAISILLMGLI